MYRAKYIVVVKKKKMGLLVVAFDVSHSIGGTAVVFETGVFTSSV